MGDQVMAGPATLERKTQRDRRRARQGTFARDQLVKDRATKEPAKAEIAQVLETCKDLGLLLGKGGLYGQTIRFSPPMCIHKQDADFILEVLDQALGQSLTEGRNFERAGRADACRCNEVFDLKPTIRPGARAPA